MHPGQPIRLRDGLAGGAATYIRHTQTHVVAALDVGGQKVVAHFPHRLVEDWRPEPVDGTAVADSDERVPAPMPIGAELGEHCVQVEREEQSAATATADQILVDGSVA